MTESKIRILYIIDYLSTGGGTENQLKALISHLDRDRFEPFLVTLAPLEGWEGFPAYHDPGCDHICLELRKIKSPKGVVEIMKLARLIRRRKFDIVQTFFVDANIVGVIAGFLGRCGTIVVSRRDLGFWYSGRLLFFLNKINRLADYFLANSDAVGKTVMEHEQVRPERVKIIRNGVFDMPDGSPSRLRKPDFGIPDDCLVAGIVANMREVKRIDNFIRVAASIKREDVHFMLVGSGPLKNRIIGQAKEAGIGERFHLAHTLDSIYEFVKLFDVGVLTSDSEGLSNTLIEYQLCGVPSVAFDVGGNSEIVDDGETGFLVGREDLEGMRSKIELLLSDEKLRSNMGSRGTEKARREFAGERMIAEHEEFYERIARKL